MLVDAIILTGGRSSRLDSISKSEFVVEESTLLRRTLNSAADARRVVVVGHEPSTTLADGVVLVREEPPFSGPVAAIAAGVVALQTSAKKSSDAVSDALLVLACDMPHIIRAVPTLLAAFEAASTVDGVIAIDEGGRRQPLAAVYRTRALVAALEAASDPTREADPLAGLAMFRLLDHMNLTEVMVAAGATADVDTWDDAVRLGASPPADAE